jgi:hypothetical protein
VEDWPMAGTIDPKLLQLNPQALNAVQGLCSLRQAAMVFCGGKRQQGYVQSEGHSSSKRPCGTLSDETLLRIL